jgi:hypothetical protein
MLVDIPGFPTEISEPIELPDIGELLMYPAFQGIDADNFQKHATDFQRYLFSKVPLRNDRQYVTVRSGVWLLEPGTRSHTNYTGDWHFDSDPRVFILSSACSALTEFNLNPLRIESIPGESTVAFVNRIGRSPEAFGIMGRKIEPGRIYTFESHLHRAVDPKRIEFRFFIRIKETDDPPFSTGPVQRLFLRSINGPTRLHVEYSADRVSICLPQSLRAQGFDKV